MLRFTHRNHAMFHVEHELSIARFGSRQLLKMTRIAEKPRYI